MPPPVIDRFRGNYDFLSNFSDSPLTYREAVYPTVEHLYQALKTEDPVEREKVRLAPNARVAKAMGRNLTMRPDWDKWIKFHVMEMCLHKKFDPWKPLYGPLIATYPAILIEGNDWGDDCWGVVLATGVGDNHLGKLLMKIRDSLLEVY